MFMKRVSIISAVLLLSGTLSLFAQQNASLYEAELLSNPNKGGKDTREVNAVLVFEKDSVKVISRRSKQVFKEFGYKEIKTVEHSFSKNPFMTDDTREMILLALSGASLWLQKEEKHWLTIVGESDFAVLKIENDNYRLIKNEFSIRKFAVVNINEDKQ